MIIYGNPIGITVGDSSSLSEGAISLNSPLPGLYFLFSNGNYSSSIDSGSVGIIQATVVTASSEGAAGALTFTLSDPLDPKTSGSEIIRFENSGGKPRVGIGFPLDEPVLTTFDIKSQEDSTTGTQIFLRSSRTTTGAQIGDSAGSISFIIDSASFSTSSKEDFQVTGSVAVIDSEVTTVDRKGVTGLLKFNYYNVSDYTNRTLFTIGDRSGGEYVAQLSADFNEIKPGPGFLESYLTIEYGSGSILNEDKVELSFITASIPSDAVTNVINNMFLSNTKPNGYYSIIIDYSLISGAVSPLSTAGRTGQFMAISADMGGIVDFTDFSTPSIGNEPSPPILSCSNGNLVITNGNGYTFRGFTKRF